MAVTLNGNSLYSGNGLDVASIVAQLTTAASQTSTQWQAQQTTINGQITALNTLESDVTTLSNDATALHDPLGAITSRLVSSSNSSIVTGTALPNTAVGSHIVTVNSLATTSAYYSSVPAASSSATIAQGSFDITVGSGTTAKTATITIDSTNDTLDKLASYINTYAQNPGVTASVVTDASGARLALVSQQSGAPGNITIPADTSVITFGTPTAGTNASLSVDGVPISSASNTVTGAVNGLTLNLVGAAVGAEVGVGVAPDTSAAANAINSFVVDYNAIINDVSSQYAYNATTQTSGPLSGDSVVAMMQSSLLADANYVAGGTSTVQTLQDIGITMNNDGTLSVDSSALATALNSNYSDVENFFQGNGTTTGFATTVSNQLTAMTDPSEGAFTVDLQGMNNSVTDLQTQINNFKTYLTNEQAAWTTYYDNISVELQELPEQEAQTNAMLGLTSPTSGSSSSS